MKQLFTLLIILTACTLAQAQTVTQSFTYTGQIETWLVPSRVTSLTVEAWGAEGGPVGGLAAGLGARIVGTVSVTPGQSLSVLVGEHPIRSNAGGGGSFVVGPGPSPSNPTPLVIAGGGGGAGGANDVTANKQGQAGNDGGNGTGPNSGTGGMGGNGGTSGLNNTCGSGGGLFTDGTGSQSGKAFTKGGLGGGTDGTTLGGFGGGGGGNSYYFGSLPYVPNPITFATGGGGGGYSGGGNAGSGGVGGGGGSFNAGTNQTNTAGANSGNGLVIISYIVQPCAPYTPTLVSSGTLTCTQTSVTLTAGGGVAGATYQFTGQTIPTSSSTLSVSASGLYSVTVTNPGGCSAVANTTVDSNTTTPVASLSNSGPLSCNNTPVVLTAAGGSSYVFSSSANQQGGPGGNTATVNGAGTYSVTVTGSNGCTNTAQTTVIANSTPPTPFVATQSTPEGLAVQITGGVAYERLKAIDRINGYEIRQTEQNQTGYFLIRESGPYAITVIGANGCRTTVTGSR